MSKIDDLIRQYCPKGVEYKELGEVCEFKRGKNLSKEVKGLGNIPIILYGELYTTYGNYIKEIVSKTSFEIASKGTPAYKTDILMPITSTTKEAQIGKASALEVQETVYIGGDAIVLSHKQNPGYMVYLLNGEWFEKRKMEYRSGATVSHLSPKGIAKIKIPVPPLFVQEEIVRVLDAFTALEAELEAELEARKRQYEYYRKQLLSNSNLLYKKYKIKEIAKIYLGLTYTPKYVEKGIKFISSQNISKDLLDLSNTKYISQEEYKFVTDNAKPCKGDILFIRVGSNLGHPTIVETDEPLCIFVSLGYLRVKSSLVVNTYLKHWMNTECFWKQVRQKTFNAPKANLNTGWMNEFEIMLPPIEEQERIVAILDKFDSLVNDISEGLPAELNARRQQYEYYRNKLLTFTEMN